MMLHEVEKRAISSTQRLLQPGLARAWLRRTPPFRWIMNEDAMATEKLAEGIRLFARPEDAPPQDRRTPPVSSATSPRPTANAEP